MKYMLLGTIKILNLELKQKQITNINIKVHQLEYLKIMKIFGILILLNQKLNQQDLY